METRPKGGDRRDSNPRQPESQSGVLPTELRPPFVRRDKLTLDGGGAKLGHGRVFGMTGSMAAGKSTVGKMLEGKGWKVIEADEIVHRLYARGGEGYGKLVDALGETILDSSKNLDRGLLAATMMRDPSLTATVNHLIHPLVRKTWKSEVYESLRLQPHRSVVVIIPLLLEVGEEESFDGKVAIGCRESVSRHRLLERGLTPEAADFWMGKQWAIEKKAQACDQVLWNEGSLELLRDQVDGWA